MKTWQNLTHMVTDMDCAQEMKKKFYGTIMGILVKTEGRPVKNVYAKYTGYNNDMKHHFYTEDDNKIILNQDTDTEVYIPDPKRGLYNTSNGVVYFQRLPYRQHKRGLYSETAMIQQLAHILFNNYAVNRFDDTIFEVLDDTQQKPYSIGIACLEAKKKNSCAINRNFCVSLSHIEPTGFSLFYDTAYVGQVDPATTTIRIDNPLFEQELCDYLRNDPIVWKLQ